MFSDAFSYIGKFLPTIFVFILVILLYKGTQYLMTKKLANGQKFSLLRQVILFLILFIGFFVVMLALPLDKELKGQILGLLGIILAASISLSSTTFLGNATAALNLGLVNSYQIGDFIRVNDKFGRVTTKGLFHTQIQTETRDFMTLPNLYLSTNPITVIRSSGTMVTAEVSLGYDVPRTKVENILIKAAESAELKDPFVFITSLGDFSITYKVHGMLKEVNKLLSYQSNLLESMIDHLHAAKIEIVSPSFMNQRQVNDQLFICETNDPRQERDTTKAEAEVFDKAEKAGKIQAKENELEALTDEFKRLKEERKTLEDKTVIDEKIERLETNKKRLTTDIEEAKDQLNKEK